ncbi:MAG: type II toxin-antitoxin system VapC family toxin [Thermoprotei archaeon]
MVSTSRKVVLDTDILVDFLRGHKAAVHTIKKLSEKRSNLATTAINIFELAWGAHRLKKIREVEELSDAIIVLNLSSKEALKAGEEMAYLLNLGITIDIRDLLIGVIARENECAVLTGNTKHLTKIRGLEVLEYQRR